MFDEPQPKNRRMTPAELADDLVLAKIFKRPLRSHILDKPFYPYVPTLNNQRVNFDLNFTE